MELEWMGRYRNIISAIVKHSNTYNRIANAKTIHYNDISLNTVEWQILEYLLEHFESNANMATISGDLGIAASSFSKNVASLCKSGLVEKYMLEGNQKNIILRISPMGRLCYEEVVNTQMAKLFKNAFSILSKLTDEELQIVEQAISALQYVPEEQNTKKHITMKKLIRVE